MQALAAVTAQQATARQAAAPGAARTRGPATAPRRQRSLHVARAESEEERVAAMKAALEQAQANPEMAARLKQVEQAMANPAMQNEMQGMMQMMSNPAFMQKMQELREDPDLKPIFEEIRSGGMGAMMKYMNDPTFLQKIGSKMGDIEGQLGAAAAAAPPPPPPPPEINNILDAAKVGDVEAIEDYMAIGKGNDADGEGRTALHYATAFERVPAVKVLLDNGADTTAKDKAGNAPLHYAAGYGREECVRLMLAAGADISATNERGETAAQVVRGNPRNPLNQNEGLMAVLEGAAELATIIQ